MYREYQPCGLLAPYVDKIWEFKGSPEYGMRINVLPDGCTDLIFALGGITQPVGNEGRIMPSCRSFLVGPMKRYSELVAYTETVHMVGIRFHPCGLFRFMDLPVQELGGQRISSADLGIKLFDDSFTERLYELPDLRSRIQCIETVLVRSMHKHDVVDKQIVFAVNHIHLYHGQREIRLLAEDTCLCQRHLERRFKLFTGFTPKEYSRIVKFRQAIDLLKNTTEANNLLSVAVNAGYYDVSHFLKEVKTLSGGTAESFLSPTLPQEGLLTYIEK